MNKIPVIGAMEICGRRFSLRELNLIIEMATSCKNLSRKEVVATICDFLNWRAPNGSLKIMSCSRALERFEKLGILSLPKKVERAKPRSPNFKDVSQLPHAPLTGRLQDVAPIELRRVTTKGDRDLWNSYVQNYHYLGYKIPFGPHIRYLMVSKKLNGQVLGCLLFTPASWALKARDEWIGWSSNERIKGLPLILNNSRFLILPWINVDELASHVLAMAARAVVEDWRQLYGQTPVLLETFVDPEKFDGACYKAANWQYLGLSSGTGGSMRQKTSERVTTSRKSIFAYPLSPQFRHFLRGTSSANITRINPVAARRDDFTLAWRTVGDDLAKIAETYNAQWQKRKRCLSSMLLVILIMRLALSKNRQGYATTINMFLHKCAKSDGQMQLGIPKELSGAALSKSRMKLDELIFKDMNTATIKACESAGISHPDELWLGHRVYAVDGSKMNLPRELWKQGFNVQTGSHYPQGLCSVLYRLRSKIPVDFDLATHHNERLCAESHLEHLSPHNVVVYDRGYFSYRLLNEHTRRGVHAVFRLASNSFPVIIAFMESGKLDEIVTIMPSKDLQYDLRTAHPNMEIAPLTLRLIRYQYKDTTYFVGTTLISPEISIVNLSDLYHARWGVEELYKISKTHIGVEEFHSKSARGVRQEVFACFFAITISRLFANQSESDLNTSPQKKRRLRTDAKRTHDQLQSERSQINFKHCLLIIEQLIHQLLIANPHDLGATIASTIDHIAKVSQRTRSGRAFPRRSYRPDPRWRADKSKQKAKVAQNSPVAQPSTKIVAA